MAPQTKTTIPISAFFLERESDRGLAMAVPTSSPAKNQSSTLKSPKKRKPSEDVPVSTPPPKRNKSPGMRVVGGRIYDSEHGKTCHQCRQKTMDFYARCCNSNLKKPCPILFCFKCLLNRYGENAEEVAARGNWICPRCRGICNCSICMKKRGHDPTGILVHAAKAIGCSSVSEMLKLSDKDHDRVVVKTKETVQTKKKPESATKSKANISGESAQSELKNKPESTKEKKLEQEVKKVESQQLNKNSEADGNSEKAQISDVKIKARRGRPSAEKKKSEERDKQAEAEMLLNQWNQKKLALSRGRNLTDSAPQSTALKSVAGIELQVNDVGPALQFLEFCSIFGKLLDLEKGQPESIIREVSSRGRGVKRGLNSKMVQFCIMLLSRIREERGDEASYAEKDGTWLVALQKCLDEAQQCSGDLQLEPINKSSSGYSSLDSSKKLKILNFLCDELLGTSEARNFIDTEKQKEDKEKRISYQDQKKELKKKIKTEVAQAMLELRNSAPFSLSDHRDLICQIHAEMKRVHASRLDSSSFLLGTKLSGILRVDPILLEGDGEAYWKLNSYTDGGVLLQDFGDWGSTCSSDKWSIFESHAETGLQNYLSSRIIFANANAC